MVIEVNAVIPGLSRRQRQVAVLIAQGYTNKEIARMIGCDHRTVEDHKYEMFRRAGVKSAIQLMYLLFGKPEITA